ncbi:MAG: hypothetical protein LC749_10655 [Actinobacteria bacterium]|nr:hypothetical protein [Actinomycetota bacterium]
MSHPVWTLRRQVSVTHTLLLWLRDVARTGVVARADPLLLKLVLAFTTGLAVAVGRQLSVAAGLLHSPRVDVRLPRVRGLRDSLALRCAALLGHNWLLPSTFMDFEAAGRPRRGLEGRST